MTHRVVINGRAAARPELGGVERWAREMAVRLPAIDPDRYRLLLPPSLLEHRAGHAWEQARLPATRGELLLCPANSGPLASRRVVLVLHDVAPLREPAWYSPSYVRWHRATMRILARRAVRVITPSRFAAQEIQATLGVEDERLAVVPGGCDQAFSPAADTTAAQSTYGLAGQRYVLTVGSDIERKNLAVLALAAARLAAEGIVIVAVGGGRPQFRAARGVAGIRALGAVPDGLLPGLYAGADAFVLPSLYEGFGLPALEAMASGTPLVVSDIPALRELCAGAAVYVDPRDAEGFAGALLDVAGGQAPGTASGLARAAGYSWERTASLVDREISVALGAEDRIAPTGTLDSADL